MVRMFVLKGLAGLIGLALLAGCSVKNPESRVDVIDDRPQIAIANAPSGAVLMVNGIEVGEAGSYDGKSATLRVPKGTHRIEVVKDGNVLLSETVFLAGDMIKTLSVPAN